MEIEKTKAIIQAILFAAGREVKIEEFMSVLELGKEELISIIESLSSDLKSTSSGIEIVKVWFISFINNRINIFIIFFLLLEEK